MFCANCGAKLPDEALFCPTCGNRSSRMNQSPQPSQPEPQPQPQPQPQPGPQAQAQTQTPPRQETSAAAGQSGVKPAPAPVHRHFPFGTIVAAIILVAAVWLLFTNGLNDPVTNLKSCTFNAYSSAYTLGEAVSRNTSNAKWTSQKIGDDNYTVTLSCVDDAYDLPLDITFSVTYKGDQVYAAPQSVTCLGDRYTDGTNLAAAMMLIYGQLDEDTLAAMMLWESLG